MTRRRFVPFAAILFACALAFPLGGCGGARSASPFASDEVSSMTGAGASLAIQRAPGGSAIGHEYFPLTPGLTSDFRVTRLGVGVRYIRVTVGEPELFFGRTASPWVYGDIPGMLRDSTLFGLRQYFSVDSAGALLFHGAQNNGFMSHTEPPLRQLLADPEAQEAWVDTVVFESFFPGGMLFFRASQVYSWNLSERAKLRLPAGTFHALRASNVITDAAPDVVSAAYGVDSAVLIDRGVMTRPGDPGVLKGLWFARRRGVVARDWPSGPGPTNTNITTFELLGQGTGPIPPAQPAP